MTAGFLVLTTMGSPATHPSRPHNGHHHHHTSLTEPLIRFPFADFLANPCGYMSSSMAEMNPSLVNWSGIVTAPSVDHKKDDSSLTPMRVLATNGTPLVQQVRDFLFPLMDRYIFYRNHTAEEHIALTQELQLAILEARHYVYKHHIQRPNVISLFIAHFDVVSENVQHFRSTVVASMWRSSAAIASARIRPAVNLGIVQCISIRNINFINLFNL